MEILATLVIATFVIAGVYVGYHYSQDPGNFEGHGIDPSGVTHAAGNGPAPAYATVLGLSDHHLSPPPSSL